MKIYMKFENNSPGFFCRREFFGKAIYLRTYVVIESLYLAIIKWICYTAQKVSVFGAILVRIFPHLDWIRKYSVSLRIQSGCSKIRTRITPNTNTFHAVSTDMDFIITLRHRCWSAYINIWGTLSSPTTIVAYVPLSTNP